LTHGVSCATADRTRSPAGSYNPPKYRPGGARKRPQRTTLGRSTSDRGTCPQSRTPNTTPNDAFVHLLVTSSFGALAELRDHAGLSSQEAESALQRLAKAVLRNP
jgi:hypothetical protein